jgi:hypothetical protein
VGGGGKKTPMRSLHLPAEPINHWDYIYLPKIIALNKNDDKKYISKQDSK